MYLGRSRRSPLTLQILGETPTARQVPCLRRLLRICWIADLQAPSVRVLPDKHSYVFRRTTPFLDEGLFSHSALARGPP
jgi:hypothetical protein